MPSVETRTAGVDPATGQLAGDDIRSQTAQILDSFSVMLESVGSDLAHVVHVSVFLDQMSDIDGMNAANSQARRPRHHEPHSGDQRLAGYRTGDPSEDTPHAGP